MAYGDSIFNEQIGRYWVGVDGSLSTITQVTTPIKEKKSIMSSLAKRVKDLALSKEDKVLRSQGFVDSDGLATDEGARVLREYLFNENKDAMVAIATKLADEDKASKKA